jgi:thiol-disulfide isomerase/thioredoxin
MHRIKWIRLFLMLPFLFLLQEVYAQKIEKVKVESLAGRIKNSEGVLIVTFWATWCKPCIEELPWFHELARKYKNKQVKLLLVSLDFVKDYPEGIASFAKREGFDSEILFLDETDADHFCPQIDPAWSGAIPATLILHNANGYRKFIEGKIEYAELENIILEAL